MYAMYNFKYVAKFNLCNITGTTSTVELPAEKTNSIKYDFPLSDNFSSVEVLVPEEFEDPDGDDDYVKSGDSDRIDIQFV